MVNVLTKEQKQIKADQIARVASELFKEKGFNQISMNEIAQKAKMSKGNLFNYYKNKENLFMTLLLVGYQNYFSSLIALLNNEPLKSTEDLKAFLIKQTKNLIENHSMLLRLNALRGPILEQKADLKETLENREKLYRISQHLSKIIHSQISAVDEDKINHIFVIQSAIISGLMNLSGLEHFNHKLTGQTLVDFQIDITAESNTVLEGYLHQILEDI